MRFRDPPPSGRPVRVSSPQRDPDAPPLRSSPRSGKRRLAHARPLLLGILLAFPQYGVAQHLTGLVVEELDGSPIASALVHLVDSAGSRISTVPTDGSGRFLLAAPGAGQWAVEVTRTGYHTLRSDPITLSAGELLPLPSLELRANLDPDDPADIPGRVILGRVLAEGFEDALGSVMIRVVSESGEFLGGALTDQHGRFRITVVEDGRVEVQALRRGSTATSRRVHVSEERGASVTLELPYTSIQPAHEEIYGGSGLTRGSHQFSRRREQGLGFHFDRQEIEALGAERLVEVFDVPGLIIEPRLQTTMGWQCLVVVYNHFLKPIYQGGNLGNRLRPAGLRHFTGARDHGQLGPAPVAWENIDLDDVEGVEIYRSYREVPDDIRHSLHLSNSIWPPDQLGGCGFAIVWTRLGW